MPPPSDLHLRCKLCDRVDLRDRRLREVIRDISSSNGLRSRLPLLRPSLEPAQELGLWATAMALGAFDSLGVLSQDAGVLVVGPDTEPAVEWLTPRAGSVRHLPDPATPLEVGEEDGSVGVILCSGAVERMRGPESARAAMRELHRVLRPGGVATVSLAYRLEGSPPGPPGRLLVDETGLRETTLGEDLTWAITSPLDLAVSSPVVERAGAHAWTSAHLLLVKPLFH